MQYALFPRLACWMAASALSWGCAGSASDQLPHGYLSGNGGASGDGGASGTAATEALCSRLATTEVAIQANLGIPKAAPPKFDANDLAAFSSGAFSFQVFDALGTPHTLLLAFEYVTQGNWNYQLLANGNELADSTNGGRSEIASGTLSFGVEGELLAHRTTRPAVVSFAKASPRQAIHLSFGAAGDADGAGFEGLMQVGGEQTVLQLRVSGTDPATGASCRQPGAQGSSFPRPFDFGGFGAPPPLTPSSLRWCPQRPTSRIQVEANLDAEAFAPTEPFDARTPESTCNFSTSISVYDSLGSKHTVELSFRKEAVRQWSYAVLAFSDDVIPAAENERVLIGTGTLTFNEEGSLQASIETRPTRVTFKGAKEGQLLMLDFGTGTTRGGTGLDGITQFAYPSNVSAQDQDGYRAGAFVGIAVATQHTVAVRYTNGEVFEFAVPNAAEFVANAGLATFDD